MFQAATISGSIVDILKNHKMLHVDALAELVDRRPSEIEDYLVELQTEGFILRDGENVKLSGGVQLV